MPQTPSRFCNSPATSAPVFACGHPNTGMRGPNGECMREPRTVMVQVSDGSGQWWTGPFPEKGLKSALADLENNGWEVLDIDAPA